MSKKTDDMKIVQVAIGDLVLDKENARKGDIAALVESLQEFGQHRPVVVQRETKKVIAGNHLCQAAEVLGWSHVNVLYVDDDDLTALRRSLADNAVGDKAQWDKNKLADLLFEAGPVPGYDEGMLEKLTRSLNLELDTTEPIFPIVARPGEKYDFVLIVAESAVDVTWLTQKMQLREEKSYKGPHIARSHVVSVQRLQELWK